jgi:hypothetical protein
LKGEGGTGRMGILGWAQSREHDVDPLQCFGKSVIIVKLAFASYVQDVKDSERSRGYLV